MLAHHAAFALGLGQGRVSSYLDQPLEARIDLISRSEAEMATVTAGLASPADFQVMGLTRDELSIPLEFTVNRDLADPHIRVTSRLPVNEPVVQLVVEVVWASGRMLRQYTLFLDPPSFPSAAPLPAPATRSEPTVAQTPPVQQPVPAAGAAVAQGVEPSLDRVERPVSETSPFVESQAEAAPLPAPDEPGPIRTAAEPEPAKETASETTSVAQINPDQGPPFDPLTVPAVSSQADSDRTTEETAEQTPMDPQQATVEPPAAQAAAASVGQEAPLDVPVPEPVPEPVTEPVTETGIEPGIEALTGPVTVPAGNESPLSTEEVLAEGRTEPQNDPEPAPEPAAIAAAAAEAAPGETKEAVTEAEMLAQAESTPAPVAESPSQAATAPEPETEPELEPEPLTEPEPVDLVFRAVIPQAGDSSPGTIAVKRGDTLWGLSRAIAEREGVAINQVMLAVQQQNRAAFLDDNINRLMAGEVLRIPPRDEMERLSAREAMVEVQRQENLYRTRWDVPSNPDAIPMISELAQTSAADASPASAERTATDSAGDPENESPAEDNAVAPEPAVPESRLVLVPPSEPDGSEQALGQGTGGASEASEGVSVVEELARTQEELANAQQENAYLEARINELESALQSRAMEESAANTGPVADNELATMEERLRDERLSGEAEPEIDLTPGDPPSWLSRFWWLLLGGFLVLVAAVVLFLRSRRDPALLPGAAQASHAASASADSESGDEEDDATRLMTALPEPDTEAVELPMDDPETQLDLARAYVAMGRNNRARELLELVIRDGTPEQEREAREMLREL